MKHLWLMKLLFEEEHDQTDSTLEAMVLYEFLEEDRGFEWWIQNRIEEFGFVEGKDYTISRDGLGEKYHLGLDMAQQLAIVQDNAIGGAIRDHLIRREEDLIESDPKLLGGYTHILRMACRPKDCSTDSTD